jgi:hypothetical protein
MNKLTALAALAALATAALACQAILSETDDSVVTFNLYSDRLEALVSRECVAMYGSEEQCTPYPNQMECDRMRIRVKPDGRTLVDCTKDGRLARSGLASVNDGVPYMCKASRDRSCVLCLDIYGNTIHDSCTRGAQLYRGGLSGFKDLPGGSAYLEEPGGAPPPVPPSIPPDAGGGSSAPPATPPQSPSPDAGGGQPAPPPNPPASPPPGGGEPNAPPSGSPAPPAAADGDKNDDSSSGDTCNTMDAFYLYAKELNRVLADEGLKLKWIPGLSSSKINPKKGFLAYGGYSHISCDYITSKKGKSSILTECVKREGGECRYCSGSGSKKTCRCYRINFAAMKAACAARPASCDEDDWSAALTVAYGVANKWLFSPSYGMFYGKVKLSKYSNKASFPKCKGSPLVLDLRGDGIEASAPADGVRFDLLGFGALQTAWVGGDDALLALDRDGDGRIESGVELFGEAAGGLPHADGFDALAKLDANGDGRLDALDAMFPRLVLWQDRNRDGVSQRRELRTLLEAGVRSLGLSRSVEPRIDRHGNDLSLRGRFTRADGSSGEMVDVFFVTGR